MKRQKKIRRKIFHFTKQGDDDVSKINSEKLILTELINEIRGGRIRPFSYYEIQK